MQSRKLLNVIVCLVASIYYVAGICDECLSNGVYCFNETSFYMCYGAAGNVVDKTQEFSCPTGEVCTGLGIICAPGDQITGVCSASTGCGACLGGGFTCTSRSTFALCSGGDITNVTGKCPTDLICDASASSPYICVKPCKGTITCNLPDPVV